jgi:hypothetical protein
MIDGSTVLCSAVAPDLSALSPLSSFLSAALASLSSLAGACSIFAASTTTSGSMPWPWIERPDGV